MEGTFKLGRVAGIEIGIHYTWLLAFALVSWSLADSFFPAYYPGWPPSAYWTVAVVSALALFASVLVHELSHSLVARSRGMGVHSITLFIFGGVSNLQMDAERPLDEFLVSIVGPLTSFVLAGLFWVVREVVAPGNRMLDAALGYLTFINLVLGVFNLLPGFPLDGGRVLRSIIWAISGSMRRATDIATYVGQGFGFLLVLWGILQILDGNFLGGLWMGLIGWFLNGAAVNTRQAQALLEATRGVRVAQLMDPHPPTVSPEMTVQEFVFDGVIGRGQHAALVVDDDGRLLGIVSPTDARELPQEAWSRTPVGAIMTRVPLQTVSPQTDVGAALQLLVDSSLNQLPVVQDGQVEGLLSRADVLQYLQLLQGPRGAGAPRERQRSAAAWRGLAHR